MPWLMFCNAACNTCWLKRRSSEASLTMAATVASSPLSRRAASSSSRADAAPSTEDNSRSMLASVAAGTGPCRGASASSRCTFSHGRKRRPASRSASASRLRRARSGVSRRQAIASSVIPVPTNRLAPTARPSGLQPVRPNSASGASQRQPSGPSASQAGTLPLLSSRVGSSSTQAQVAKPASTPAMAARGGVCGRQMANPSTGTSVAIAENEIAPMSASTLPPPIRRLYAQASSMITQMPARRSHTSSRRWSPPARAQVLRSRPGANQWLPIIRLRVNVLTTTMPVAALSPPRKANSATPVCPAENGRARVYMSLGTLSPSRALPARARGRIGSAISSRYSGNSQREVRMSAGSRHSTTPTWNWCGSRNIASAPSSTSGMKPPAGASATGAGGGTATASSPNQTKAPSASIAPSLNSDSAAIASTSPRLCSDTSARRAPNSIANSAIASATYSALSRQGAASTASAERRVSMAKLIATALSCSAM